MGGELGVSTGESPVDDIGLAPLVNYGFGVELQGLLERRVLLDSVIAIYGEREGLRLAGRQSAVKLIASDLACALVGELATADDGHASEHSGWGSGSGSVRLRNIGLCV